MIPPQRRHIGVLLLALSYLWIGGCGTLFAPFIFGVAFVSNDFSSLLHFLSGGSIHSAALLKVLSFTLLTLFYLFYVAYLVIGIGLWKLKNWARKAVIVINLVAAVIGVVVPPFIVRWMNSAFSGQKSDTASAFLALGLTAWLFIPFAGIAWYMHRPRVRFAFGAWRPKDGSSAAEFPPALSRLGKSGVAAAAVATFVLFAFGLFMSIEDGFRSSDVYRLTLQETQASPCASAIFGNPLTTKGWMGGEMSETGDTGTATLEIPIQGPKGKGNIQTEGEKLAGAWTIKSIVLERGSDRFQIKPPDPNSTCH